MTKEEYDFIGTMKGRNVVSASQQTELNKIYNRVFHDNVQPTNCGSVYARPLGRVGYIVQRLLMLYTIDIEGCFTGR